MPVYQVAGDATLSSTYRDLAVLRRALVAGADQPVAERRTALQAMGASLAWAFADTGVAARAHQRVGAQPGVKAPEQFPNT